MRHRVVAALALMLAAAVVVSVLASVPSAAAADPAASGSTVTVSGKGDFATLKVTVSQTKNLVNQTVKVSWTGGTQTVGAFSIDFLQIMQCWGDDPTGPDRTQCQFGGLVAQLNSIVNDSFILGRVVTSGYDPAETLKGPAPVYVPFWAAGRPKPTGIGAATNEFFDSQVTNEIPVARTHGDGTGEEFFEIETVRQAAGLGCGEPVPTAGRSCWLVVVPRGNKDVSGGILTGSGTPSGVSTSPLSQSNWDRRIVVPLEFQPAGQPCPIGAPERSLIGHELAVEAVSSWQPALCAGGGALFSYTQLPDEVARSQVRNGGLVLVTDPIPSDEVRADHPLVYAPVGLSGLTFAFDINYVPDGQHQTGADLESRGRRFTSMKLTPRLVAKLLTQSYLYSLDIQPVEVKKNPKGLLYDPEFLDLNPEYKGFVDIGGTVPDALVQLNGADVTSLLWRWVVADPDARAFLAGTPDKFGMVVNPNNKNLPLPTSTIPRNDQTCQNTDDGALHVIPDCNLDAHPYANDMHDAGRSASRGDSLGRFNKWNDDIKQPVSTKKERQSLGAQALIAVVDAATAARYELPTAQLRNAAGKYVAPTPESLLAGAAAMKPSAVAGVLAADPGAGDPAAYPLTALSYAVNSPTMLDAAAGKDYVAFLRYAGGPGQRQGLDPGQLPPGMVPLPGPLKAQTIAAAAAIEKQTTPTSPPAPPPTTTDSSSGPGPAAAPSAIATPAPRPGAPQTSATSGAKAPSVVAQQPVAGVRRTPSLPGPWWVSGLLLVILIASGLAAASSPVIQTLGGRLRHRLRKGVTPTEQ